MNEKNEIIYRDNPEIVRKVGNQILFGANDKHASICSIRGGGTEESQY